MGISQRQSSSHGAWISIRNTRMDARVVTCYRTGPEAAVIPQDRCVCPYGSSTIFLGVHISRSRAIASGPVTASFEPREDNPFPGEDEARRSNATKSIVRVCGHYLLVEGLCLCNLTGQATNDLSWKRPSSAIGSG